MSRLHRKCLFASAATHLLLLALLLVSPAFVPSTREPDLPRLTFIPLRLTDEALFGGGTPGAPPPPASPPAPAQPIQTPKAQVIPAREPDPTPPENKPTKKIEPERAPAKPAQRPKPSKEPVAKPEIAEKPAKPKHEVKPTFEKSSDKSQALAQAKARAKAEADARAAREKYLESVNKLGQNLSRGLSPSTTIDMPGPGGGEAYANYDQAVKSAYMNAWFPPDDLSDDSVTVKAKVVILRDGTVRSAIITKPSRIPGLDASVTRALNLRSIAPFPETTKDTERTYNLDFNLKTRRSQG